MLIRFKMVLRALMRLPKAERELDEELRYHIGQQTEQNIRLGMNPEEARYAAHKAFGGVEQAKERSRDARGGRWLEDLWRDFRYGARMLAKNPGFSLIAVITLALGIGANTAIFSAVNAVLLRPLPYYEPQRLVFVAKGYEGDAFTGADAKTYLQWLAESKAFDHLVAFKSARMYLSGQGNSERLDAVFTTASLFPALGVMPQLGRTFTPEEDRLGGAHVAVMSHALWQRRFGGDPAIIGKSLMLRGESRTIIGVMPPSFRFIRKADVLLPSGLDGQRELTVEQTNSIDNVFGRLKPRVSVERARTELDSILQRHLPHCEPNSDCEAPQHVKVTPMGERLTGHFRYGLLVLFGAVGFVLLIACANVANLMLVRGAARQKELAIRAAMGASRVRLIRQMLTESLALSILGGTAGLLLALLVIKALVTLTPEDLSQIRESSIDGPALGFTLLASLLTGIISGLIPALHTSRIDLTESLKESARSAAFSMHNGARRVSPALVAGELALTLALLAGAGLLVKSFLQLRSIEPGYNPENLLTMMVPLDSTKYPQGSARQRSFYRELLTRINALPGVKVAAMGPLPLTGTKRIVARPPDPNSQRRGAERSDISPDYFRAMGIKLLAGRILTDHDDENAPPVIVINETLARYHFPGKDPIGKTLYNLGSIVGVVSDVKRFGLESEAQSECYHSYLQCKKMYEEQELMVRTEGDPIKLTAAVQQQVWAIDRDQAIESLMSMEQRLSESVAPRRFQMMLFGAFAVVALIIATVGVYGVISYAVSQRTHEIGIRMALGAQAKDVMRMMIWQGMCLALIGVSLGLAAALALTRVMQGLLFNVSATDPATFTLIVLLLIGVTLIASYVPARRATKVDPMQALRHE